MNAGKIMDEAIVTLRRDATLSEIFAVMNRYRQTDFPIVDSDSQLVGMLYEEDLFAALGPSFQNLGAGETDFSEAIGRTVQALTLRADEMMTPAIGWVSTETSIVKLAIVMREKKVRCLPVFGDGRVLGLVTERAVFMALLKQSLSAKKASVEASQEPIALAASIQDRRRHPRKAASFKLAYKPVSFKLSYKTTDSFGNPTATKARIARCLNLSLGGMLVDAPESFDKDDVLDAAFEIPGSQLPIRRLARVTWSAAGARGQYQLGLFFLALSVHESAALDAYLKTLPD